MTSLERALEKAQAVGRMRAAESSGAVLRAPTPGREGPDVAARGGTVEVSVAGMRTAQLAPPADLEQRIAEEFRVIKRPLLRNASNRDLGVANGNVIMVGSALPGAGKSFTSFNLALSIATELDWSVLLVDGDFSRLVLTRAFGLTEAAGLSTLIENEQADPADFVYKTNFPRLNVMPAGPARPHAKELLGSQRMGSLISMLARRERHIVVLDSPPLLPTSEGRVLASYVGQVVLVVEAGVTSRRSLADAIELLDPAKAVGLVLNKHRPWFGSGDHHHYYASYGTNGGDGGS